MMKYFLFFLFLMFCTLIGVAQHGLGYYISFAKQNSPLIKDNQNQRKANELEAERLKAFFTKPQVGIVANYLFAPILATDNKSSLQLNAGGADKYFGYDLGITNGGQYQALLNVTQPLFGGKKFQVANEQVEVNKLINENNIKLSVHDIEKLVTDQYILCLQDELQIDFIEQLLHLISDQQSVLKKLVEGSIYKRSDLLLLHIEQQNNMGQLAVSKANYRSHLYDLNIIAGIADTTLVKLDNNNLVLAMDIDNSGYLQKYLLDSSALAAQENTLELKYKPQVSAFANTVKCG